MSLELSGKVKAMNQETDPGNEGKKRKQKTNLKPRKKVKPEIDCDKLIQLVQGHSCIWDKSCSSYKDNSRKTRAWNTISVEMNAPGNSYGI